MNTAVPMTKSRDAGFTLIEVLAALVVFSLSIVSLIHVGTESLKTGYALEQKMLAGIVADNQLTLAIRDDLKLGKQTGQSEMKGRPFEWSVETSAQDVPGFFKVEARVIQRPDGQLLITRTAFRRGDAQ